MQAAGIRMYMRYRDDGLILVSNINSFKIWFAHLKSAAGYFKLEVEEVIKFDQGRTVEMDFLQSTIMMCHQTCKLRAKPSFKNEGVPLDQNSAHNPAVHKWPVAQLRQLARVSSDADAAELGKSEYIDMFRKHLSNDSLLSQLQSTSIWPPQNNPRRREGSSNTWMPLSWHPVWKFAGFSRVLRSMHQPEMRHLVDGCFGNAFLPVKIAWRNKLMYSMNWLAKL